MNHTKTLFFSLFILLFTFTLSQSASAQERAQLGIKGGVNFATFNDANDAQYRPGFVFGTFLDLPVENSPLSLQPELLFAQYGSNIEDSDAYFEVDYIQIPVLLKFDFAAESNTTPNVYFGPYLSFTTSSEVKNENFAINFEDETEPTDFGAIVGIGFDTENAQIGFRYTAGITNIEDSSFESDAKNGAFSVTVGLKF
ncbi:MAG: PorT family protein [Balneolaceae bacterium]|nr:PorT family protein [Balneolaceae bacterium]